VVVSGLDRKEELARSLSDVQVRIQEAATRASRKKDDVTLVVVTKTYPVSDVEILHKLGVTDFGENRSAEGLEKSALISAHWHFQGQIQSNKIVAITSWAHTVHSLDDHSHVAKFDRAVGEIPGKRLNVFIQISLDGDTSRAGVRGDDLLALGESISSTNNLDLVGLMVVPPVQAEPEKAFSQVAEMAQRFRIDFPMAQSLSAGMSGDYEVAIAHGATHIRVGSQILGPRPTHA
jgi:pyridoxal phosphate enzyme (YggS family)